VQVDRFGMIIGMPLGFLGWFSFSSWVSTASARAGNLRAFSCLFGGADRRLSGFSGEESRSVFPNRPVRIRKKICMNNFSP
jgi:hypothetical protein